MFLALGALVGDLVAGGLRSDDHGQLSLHLAMTMAAPEVDRLAGPAAIDGAARRGRTEVPQTGQGRCDGAIAVSAVSYHHGTKVELWTGSSVKWTDLSNRDNQTSPVRSKGERRSVTASPSHAAVAVASFTTSGG